MKKAKKKNENSSGFGIFCLFFFSVFCYYLYTQKLTVNLLFAFLHITAEILEEMFIFWYHKERWAKNLKYFCHSCVKTEKLAAERGDCINKLIILYVSRDSEKTCLNSFHSSACTICIFPRSYCFHYYLFDYSSSLHHCTNFYGSEESCNLLVSTFVTTLSNLKLIYRIF